MRVRDRSTSSPSRSSTRDLSQRRDCGCDHSRTDYHCCGSVDRGVGMVQRHDVLGGAAGRSESPDGVQRVRNPCRSRRIHGARGVIGLLGRGSMAGFLAHPTHLVAGWDGCGSRSAGLRTTDRCLLAVIVTATHGSRDRTSSRCLTTPPDACTASPGQRVARPRAHTYALAPDASGRCCAARARCEMHPMTDIVLPRERHTSQESVSLAALATPNPPTHTHINRGPTDRTNGPDRHATASSRADTEIERSLEYKAGLAGGHKMFSLCSPGCG
jgi:hypothetical protein